MCLCADIACGCGAFLYTLAETIHERTQVPFVTIFHHLYGVDISEMSITRAKILLSLVALLHGEYIKDEDLYNIFNRLYERISKYNISGEVDRDFKKQGIS